ncbi:YjbH domain-containing protein [Luteimonas aquatica]|uniref:YjbH domain-containing protein n=1 Tax=Luteimonas aquatica TaxID=450364 RepID=UPI001F5897E2|nr:YjbH domain-containing protein [Luteimonas aquatica]
MARTAFLVGTGWLLVGVAQAGEAPTQTDFGGAGHWQTPSARMAEEGELSFTANRTEPYTRYNVTLQPFSWMETSFRYVAVTNRPYSLSPSLSGDQSYKDKSIDAKLRLLKESRYLPEVAIGGRDIGGTGHFGSEFVVASKRFGDFDTSLGLAWGYIGNRGDFSNPFAVIDDKFRTRPGRDDLSGTGGEFNTIRYFRGRPSLFGGIVYQRQGSPWVLKLEYEGNDYKHEPRPNSRRNEPQFTRLKQRSPINVGVVYRVNRNIDLSAAYERGNTMMFGLTLHGNIGSTRGPAKALDPPPPVRAPGETGQPVEQVDWASVSKELHGNAGIRVSKIAQRGRELLVTGEQDRYLYPAKGVGRAARVLGNRVDAGTDWFTVVSTREGMQISETSIDRRRFDAFLAHDIDLKTLRLSVEQNVPLAAPEKVLYRAPLDRYTGGFSLGYSQNIGGPDAFVLYKLSANYDAEFRFTPNLWFNGSLSGNLLDNYDRFKYTAPSRLPRVRTHVREYLTSSRITMPLFQLTATRRLGADWYGLAYAGMLESMYGGVGGEVLYRPFGERWAFGMDLNWVKKRSFEQDFTFRRYSVVTGHVSGYFNTGYKDILLAVSAGRYLARDWGVTFDASRSFRNGVRMGAYATFTNVSAQEFGEGSFDKGIYVSIPFDLMQGRSTPNRARFVWAPLIRDGGARLSKQYALYTLTEDRDSDLFNDNLDKIGE